MSMLLIPGVSLALGTLVAAVAAVVIATRRNELASDIVDPFYSPPAAHPSADTLSNRSPLETTPCPVPADRPWQVATVASLCDVESLMDALEAHGFAEREMLSLGKKTFAVRWR